MNKNIIALFAYLYLIYNYSKCCNTTKAVITITFILVLTLNNIDGLNVGSPVQGADDQIDIPVKPGVPVMPDPNPKPKPNPDPNPNPNPNPNPRPGRRPNRRPRNGPRNRYRNYFPYLYERPVFIQSVVPDSMDDIFSLQNLLLFLLYLYLMIYIIKKTPNKFITTVVISIIIFYDRIINILKK